MAEPTINGQLRRIEKKVDDLIEAQMATQKEVVRMTTSQETLIERTKEDRARLSVLEGNVSKLWGEIGQVKDRQRGWAALQGVVAAVFAGIAAWLGIQK